MIPYDIATVDIAGVLLKQAFPCSSGNRDWSLARAAFAFKLLSQGIGGQNWDVSSLWIRVHQGTFSLFFLT